MVYLWFGLELILRPHATFAGDRGPGERRWTCCTYLSHHAHERPQSEHPQWQAHQVLAGEAQDTVNTLCRLQSCVDVRKGGGGLSPYLVEEGREEEDC